MHAAGALMCIPIPTPGPLLPLPSSLSPIPCPTACCHMQSPWPPFVYISLAFFLGCSAVAFLRFRFRLIFASLAWHTYTRTHMWHCRWRCCRQMRVRRILSTLKIPSTLLCQSNWQCLCRIVLKLKLDYVSTALTATRRTLNSATVA